MFLTRCISYFLLMAWIFSSSQSYATAPVNFDHREHISDLSKHEPVSESAEQYLNAVEIDFKNDKSKIYIPSVIPTLNECFSDYYSLHHSCLLSFLNNTTDFSFLNKELLIKISILRI